MDLVQILGPLLFEVKLKMQAIYLEFLCFIVSPILFLSHLSMRHRPHTNMLGFFGLVQASLRFIMIFYSYISIFFVQKRRFTTLPRQYENFGPTQISSNMSYVHA